MNGQAVDGFIDLLRRTRMGLEIEWGWREFLYGGAARGRRRTGLGKAEEADPMEAVGELHALLHAEGRRVPRPDEILDATVVLAMRDALLHGAGGHLLRERLGVALGAGTRRIRVSGRSDDLVEIEGARRPQEPDEVDCYEVGADLRIETAEGTGLGVVARYGGSGCWGIGLRPLEEDRPIARWPLRIRSEGYTALLDVEAPEEARITLEEEEEEEEG